MRRSALVKRVLIVGFLFLSPYVPELASAQTGPGDDAVVLPKGYGRVLFDAQFYIPFDKRFNNNGQPESFGAPLSVPLDTATFPALAGLNPFLGGATASLGQ